VQYHEYKLWRHATASLPYHSHQSAFFLNFEQFFPRPQPLTFLKIYPSTMPTINPFLPYIDRNIDPLTLLSFLSCFSHPMSATSRHMHIQQGAPIQSNSLPTPHSFLSLCSSWIKVSLQRMLNICPSSPRLARLLQTPTAIWWRAESGLC